MENLNAEQVKKALECCAKEWRCGLCGFTEKECALIKKSALALINKQETEYNELYELCESYRIERDAMRGAANSYKMHNKKLTEENEKLKKILSSVARFDTSLLCAWCREEQTKKIAKEMLEGVCENTTN